MKCGKKVVLFTLFAMNLVDQPAPEVSIEQGTLSGKISTDGSFFEYIGIPYASTNSTTRFKAPLPPPKWEGVYKAVDEMYQCPQHPMGLPIEVVGTEDCLKINVYVPATAQGPLPVMVYIHGGAYVLGNGGKMVIGPDFLVKQNVILVTFNYRLGVLGFLCLHTEEAPGNAGLKDQVAALRWVKKNIAAFGGDPDNVTIFGTSAGAASVSLLVASKSTDGLFKRAIMHSGSSLASWAISNDPISVASNILTLLGYDTKDPKEIYEIFSKLAVRDIVLATTHSPIPQLLTNYLLPLPCVEKHIPGVESVLTDLPYNLMTRNPKNISLMLSSTDKEGLFFINVDTKETLESKNKQTVFGDDLVFKTKDEENEIDREIKKYYFNGAPISERNIMNLSDLYTHSYFEMPVIFEAEIMAKKIEAPVYSYYFTYSGGRNYVKSSTKYKNVEGACHGDDLFYTFQGTILPFRVNKDDQKIVDWLTKMLTNFAKYGNPSPKGEFPIKWLPHTRDQLNFLNIGDILEMTSMRNPDIYHTWKRIYDKYRRNEAKL
uniref:Carboxylic ester hydrolase n=1 Tax=Spodoptera littoralis TaxID=7109 RepID=D3GDL9_SPOLI|nr:antennal esterase CXE8 [Spodoptera littoralis]